MINTKYWSPETQTELEEIVRTQDLDLYNISKNLQKSLKTIASAVIYKTNNIYPDDDYINDVISHLVCTTILSINPKKQQAAFSYIWTAARNVVINVMRYEQYRQTHELTTPDVSITGMNDSYNADYPMDVYDTRCIIINELNNKIKAQKSINRVNSVFLICMKEYLLDNEFDPSGFMNYVMDKMSIKLSTYRSIISRLNIKGKIFNKVLEDVV